MGAGLGATRWGLTPVAPHCESHTFRQRHPAARLLVRRGAVAVAFGGTVFTSGNDWKSNLRWFMPHHKDKYTQIVVRRVYFTSNCAFHARSRSFASSICSRVIFSVTSVIGRATSLGGPPAGNAKKASSSHFKASTLSCGTPLPAA